MENLNDLGPRFSAEAVEPQSLRDALAAVSHEARQSGLAERTVRGAYEAPARSVLRYLPGDLPIKEIGFEDIRSMVRRCLAENLTPATVRRNYLRVLKLAYERSGFGHDDNPVNRVLTNMRSALRVSRPPIVFFEPDELHEVLRRIEGYRSTTGRSIRCKPRDLAIFRLVAFRGLRAGEIERIQIERDIDFRLRTMKVHPKVVTLPRTVKLSGALLDDVITLVAARTEGPLVEGGMKRLNSICEVWKRRLGEPRLNLRNLRRSLATALDAEGAGIGVIGQALGHVPGSAVTSRYVGQIGRQTDEMLKRVEHLGSPPVSAR